MKKFILTTAMILASAGALAGPKCTDGDNKSKWIPADQFKQNLLDQGYQIKKFKVTSGGCYEIYGYNQNKQKVEIYYHPETAKILKQEIDG